MNKYTRINSLWGWVALVIFAVLVSLHVIKPKSFTPLFRNVVKVIVSAEYSSWEGSAVFIDDNLLITAGHVVDGAVEVEIIKSNGESYIADEWYLEDISVGDIGFIVIDTNEIEPKATFDDAVIGEEVWAIGNPFGAFPVLTKGIVSSVNAPDTYLSSKNMLITDCPINPGNSGCPLLDVDGNILGICSWGYNISQGMSYFCRAEICELIIEKYYLLKKIERIK